MGINVKMKKHTWLLFLMICIAPALSVAGEPDAGEIIGRAWDYMRGKSSVSVVHMTVHRADWERKSTIKAWTRGRKNSIFRIIAPKKDRGSGTLKLDRDMWTYNPKINRVVKIPPSMMSRSWMGSDFSNNDLSKADTILIDYTHEIVAQETVGGFIVYKIRSMPKPAAPVIWGMQMLKIREDGVLVEQAFYDEDMEMVKIMTTTDVQDMGGKPFPLKWTMRSVDAESDQDYTLLVYEDLTFDVVLRDDMFTLNALRKPLR